MTTSTASQTGKPTPALLIADTWLVIPLYNRATIVREVISQTRTVFPHVVVIDDGSKDTSAREAAAAGVMIVHHPISLSQDAALQTGFSYVLKKTNADYVVAFDADGQHSTTDAAAMVTTARTENLAVVLDSRFLEGPSPVGWLKRTVLHAAATVSSHTSGIRLTDAHNDLRVLRRDVLVQLDLGQNQMVYASGIIRQTGTTGVPWREPPVHIVYTDYSRAKGQSPWNSVNILVDLLFS